MESVGKMTKHENKLFHKPPSHPLTQSVEKGRHSLQFSFYDPEHSLRFAKSNQRKSKTFKTEFLTISVSPYTVHRKKCVIFADEIIFDSNFTSTKHDREYLLLGGSVNL